MATPEHWTEATLGEVTQLRPGKYLKKSDYEAGGPFPVYGSNSVMGSHIESLYDGPLVVMAGIGAYAGAVRLSKDRCWVNNNAFAILPSDTVRAEYLYFWLDTELDLGLVRAGTGQPYIQKDHLNSVSFTMPPLNEQLRIVDLIESVDSYIDALRVQAAAARTARTSLLNELLNVGGDDWENRTLGELCEIKQGTALAAKAMDGGRFPVFGANGIIGSHSESNHSKPIVALGCRGSCGAVHLVTEEAWLANNVMALWPRDERIIDIRFLQLICEVTDWVATGAQSGQVQQQITRAGLSPVPVLLPPFEVQKRVVDLVGSVDSYMEALRVQAVPARSTRTSLVKELLSGDREIPESYDDLLGAS